MCHQIVNAVYKESPYQGVKRSIHVALADYAKPDGTCFPKQQTLAEKVGCSVQYVRKVLAEMRRDGLIEWWFKNRQHVYRLIMPNRDRNSGAVKKETEARSTEKLRRGPYIEEPPKEPPTDPPTTNLAPAAQDEEDTVVVRGRMPEDPPVSLDSSEEQPKRTSRFKRKRDLPKKGTFEWVARRFENEAHKAGHQAISVGVLRRSIQRLRDVHELTYDEIDEVVQTFFVREASFVRRAEDVAVAFQYCIPRLLKFTESGRANMRRTGISSVEVNRKMMGEKWQQILQANQ